MPNGYEDEDNESIDPGEENPQSGQDQHAERLAFVRSIAAQYAAGLDQGHRQHEGAMEAAQRDTVAACAAGGNSAGSIHEQRRAAASFGTKNIKRGASSRKRDGSQDDQEDEERPQEDMARSLPQETREEKKRRMSRITAKKKRDRQKIEIEVLNDERISLSNANQKLEEENAKLKQTISAVLQVLGQNSSADGPEPAKSAHSDSSANFASSAINGDPQQTQVPTAAPANSTTVAASIANSTSISNSNSAATTTPANNSFSDAQNVPLPSPRADQNAPSLGVDPSAVLLALSQLLNLGQTQTEAMQQPQTFERIGQVSNGSRDAVTVVMEGLMMIASAVQQIISTCESAGRPHVASLPSTTEANVANPHTGLVDAIPQSTASQKQQQMLASACSQALLSVLDTRNGNLADYNAQTTQSAQFAHAVQADQITHSSQIAQASQTSHIVQEPHTTQVVQTGPGAQTDHTQPNQNTSGQPSFAIQPSPVATSQTQYDNQPAWTQPQQSQCITGQSQQPAYSAGQQTLSAPVQQQVLNAPAQPQQNPLPPAQTQTTLISSVHPQQENHMLSGQLEQLGQILQALSRGAVLPSSNVGTAMPTVSNFGQLVSTAENSAAASETRRENVDNDDAGGKPSFSMQR